MSNSLRADIGTLPRRNVARAQLRGEATFNFLEQANLGPVIAATLGYLKMTADQFGRELEYPDGTIVSKWINNVEPPQIVRIWAKRNVRAAFLKALASDSGQSVRVKWIAEIDERTA